MEHWKDMCIAVMPAHTKCGNDLIRMLLYCDMRVIAFVPFLQNAVTLRSQMDTRFQSRFFYEQCDTNNMASIEPAILKAKLNAGMADFLIVPIPINNPPYDDTRVHAVVNINPSGLKLFMHKYVQYLMPSIKEQRIWMIDYAFGKENEVIQSVVRELISLPKLARPVNLNFMEYPVVNYNWN